MRRIAPQLDLGGHPLITSLPQRTRQSTLRTVLAKVVYMCDMESRFESLKEFMKFDKARKNRQRYRDERNIGALALHSDAVHQRALLDHMRLRMEPLLYFSMPKEIFPTASIGSFLEGPATKRRRLPEGEGDGDAALEDLEADVEGPDMAEAADERIFFRVAAFWPGYKHCVKISIGSGSRLSANHIAMAVHRATAESTLATPVLDSEPIGAAGFDGGIKVLDYCSLGDPHAVAESLEAWKVARYSKQASDNT